MKKWANKKKKENNKLQINNGLINKI